MSITWNKESSLKLPGEVALEFSLIRPIGEGTYGKVYIAEHMRTRQQCAIKIVSLLNVSEGVPPTTMREMALLRDLHHPNIVNVAFVFELCANDLGRVLDSYIKSQAYLPRGYIRSIMYQIVKALEHIHERSILHRDIKPQNVLLAQPAGQSPGPNGLPPVAKLADFGLSVMYGLSYLHEQKYCTAITLWYRPPELLLGEIYYNVESEIWSLGCLFLELLLTHNILNGNSEVQQLRILFSLLDLPVEGPSNEEKLDQLGKVFKDVDFHILKFLHGPICHNKSRLKYYLPYVIDPPTQDLVLRMLTLDPSKRITLKEVLEHEYFKEDKEFIPAVSPPKFVQVAQSLIPKLTINDVGEQPLPPEVIYEENLTRLAKEAIARDYQH